MIRDKLIKERGSKCQICGKIGTVGLFHIKSRGAYPRLTFYIPNLLLAEWYPCHANWHHNFYQAREIEKRIKEICGKDYEDELIKANLIQPRLTMTYLKTLYYAYKA